MDVVSEEFPSVHLCLESVQSVPQPNARTSAKGRDACRRRIGEQTFDTDRAPSYPRLSFPRAGNRRRLTFSEAAQVDSYNGLDRQSDGERRIFTWCGGSLYNIVHGIVVKETLSIGKDNPSD